MTQRSNTPDFRGLSAASPKASYAAQKSSKKADTKCELVLRRSLWKVGFRYRLGVRSLPGKPDIVFVRERLAVFCDGDFWHGRDLENRLVRLGRGHNPQYWVAKIRRNVERDLEVCRELQDLGWRVIRLWESDVLQDPSACVARIAALLGGSD